MRAFTLSRCGVSAPAADAAQLLAALGARVTRVLPPKRGLVKPLAVFDELSTSCTVDLKSDDWQAELRDLLRTTDVLIRRFRPSATESIGLGPTVRLSIDLSLFYARMTGWVQTGTRPAWRDTTSTICR